MPRTRGHTSALEEPGIENILRCLNFLSSFPVHADTPAEGAAALPVGRSGSVRVVLVPQSVRVWRVQR